MTATLAMTDVVVLDGSTVCLRQAEEGDVAALLQLLESLSPQSLYYRFHGRPALSESSIRGLIGLDGRSGNDSRRRIRRPHRCVCWLPQESGLPEPG
jgi:hypothetical protein